MNIEAFWSADFRTSQETLGNGVVLLLAGRVYGGNSNYYCSGTYAIQGTRLLVKLGFNTYGKSAADHSTNPAWRASLSGTLGSAQVEMTGTLDGDENTPLEVSMQRLAETSWSNWSWPDSAKVDLTEGCLEQRPCSPTQLRRTNASAPRDGASVERPNSAYLLSEASGTLPDY